MKNIALLCNQNPNEATFRINFLGMLKASKQLGFHCDFLENFTTTPDVILTQRQYKLTDDIKSKLAEYKASGTKIATFVNDIYKVDANILLEWAYWSDIILTPTDLHKQFIQSITDTRVEVMIDCIDFSIDEKTSPTANNNIPKICWFGYMESYSKSMAWYDPVILDLVKQQKLEYHLITNPNVKHPLGFPAITYKSDTFKDTLSQYDGCILSHAPLDWDINTFVKSPNKLILSTALGIPAIVSNTPSYSKILTDVGLSEFIFSGSKSFKNSLELLLDKNQRINYINKSQDYVISKFSYLEMTKQFLNIING